ncbi:phosphatase 2C-like domain-containing protein [Mycena rebaudengoi]|nr:phosphatase 2C-like domain-containing protein [Mycena rebaudengoi]
MKHSRFYTSLPRVGRVRSNSASRSLYTSSNLPSFFDSAPPPPNSRPVISTNRLPIEAKGEVEGPSQSHHGPLALTAPHATASSPSSAQFSLFFQYPLFVTPPLPASSTATAGTHPSTRRHRPRFQLDVGAYGIPKRCRPAPTLSRRCYHTDAPLAVQVGEDAYFIRDNAMGVADGVGGWARVKPPSTLSPTAPSASALFARRLMHYCADEVEHVPAETLPVPILSRNASPWHCAHTPAPSRRTSSPRPTRPPPAAAIPLPFLVSAPAPPPPTPLLAGSSTALLAVLDYLPASADSPAGAVLKIAHIGDSMGMLVRGDALVWRSEEMWWAFNTPVQLGPTNPDTTPRSTARVVTLPVQEGDIVILASDGLSDNLWDEEVVDEVVRMRRGFLGVGGEGAGEDVLRRRTLAGMLSEALCSRARRVAERKASNGPLEDADDTPFARRAQEQGRAFRGGKNDDISVIVAVISPADNVPVSARAAGS